MGGGRFDQWGQEDGRREQRFGGRHEQRFGGRHYVKRNVGK